ncbi:hypothetical protein [Nocardia crassostreae]|uniref:hypothetical protein n=1 Tax=Nocardia crassostreae TaxID=53428 RepID=UPI00157C76BB|nr:hypothetical protein [Nocardia crassostreae]
MLYRRFDGDLALVKAAGTEERVRDRGLAPRAITASCVRRIPAGSALPGVLEVAEKLG